MNLYLGYLALVFLVPIILLVVLFRCVLNWFGDWSTGALYQVGREFTNKMDLEKGNVSKLCISGCSLSC